MSMSSLNVDLLDRIFTSLIDFQSLASLLLTSKSIYSVYSARPSSIKRAVAYNVVGPALPHAVRFIRCDRVETKQIPVEELLGEDELETNPSLTSADIRKLIKITEQAQELEDIFSWREKDHAFRTSRLSAVESYRFRRALFRICLFFSVYYFPSLPEDSLDDVHDLEDNQLQLRQQFFDVFPTPELKEIGRLGAFFWHLATWSARAHSIIDFTDILLSNESLLDTALGVYRGTPPLTSIPDLDLDDLPDNFANFLSSPLDHVLSKRKESSHAEEAILLPSTPEITLECDQCHTSVSTRKLLWGPTDWEYLRGYVTPTRMCMLLKGHLPHNIGETRTTFRALWTEHPYEVLISEVFDCMTPAYDNWTKESLLCLRCLCQFLRDHLHLWYTQRNQSANIVRENCWYGYNCRTQIHKYAHAVKLNHWCEPISGDSIVISYFPVPLETDF